MDSDIAHLRFVGPEGHTLGREIDEAAMRAALARNPVPLVPCHCDPLCENFIDTGARMWVVDWEYSGMNDPMWDLGDLSVEGGFDAVQFLLAALGMTALTASLGKPLFRFGFFA